MDDNNIISNVFAANVKSSHQITASSKNRRDVDVVSDGSCLTDPKVREQIINNLNLFFAEGIEYTNVVELRPHWD